MPRLEAYLHRIFCTLEEVKERPPLDATVSPALIGKKESKSRITKSSVDSTITCLYDSFIHSMDEGYSKQNPLKSGSWA